MSTDLTAIGLFILLICGNLLGWKWIRHNQLTRTRYIVWIGISLSAIAFSLANLLTT